METGKFYLDESGCFTTDIKRAKVLICSKGVFVKPKCFVDKNLKVVSDISKVWGIVNAYDKDRLQVMLLQSGGPVVRKFVVKEMSKHVVADYPTSYKLEPMYPTSKICLLANFMEAKALVTNCFTDTQIVDREGKIKNPRVGHVEDLPASISGIKRSFRVDTAQHGKTSSFADKKGVVIEDVCCKSNSYPAFLISFTTFKKLNPEVDFLKDYLYFCE
ncbi:MAG: hypothetical protein IJ019_05335 [Alphaproteobacteria bacterium]|nr:hypothetical protein [Alphaproteobacteria bacterium]